MQRVLTIDEATDRIAEVPPPGSGPAHLRFAVVESQSPPAPPGMLSRIHAAWTTLTRLHWVLTFVGVAALIWWSTWWFQNVRKLKQQKTPASWYQPFPFIGLDFLHNYQAARFIASGGDPYLEPFGDPLHRKLCYPPIVLPFFFWCQYCSVPRAIGIWVILLSGYAATGAYAAWRTRQALGISPIPLPFALAAILTCAPVGYALERGNYDLALVPLIVLAAWALREKTIPRDLLAGACLALATCLKIYPGLLILALMPMQRYRVVMYAGLAGMAFASYQPENLPVFVENLKDLAKAHHAHHWGGQVQPVNHSLTLNWQPLWMGTKLDFLASFRGSIACVLFFVPLCGIVSYRLYYCPNRKHLYLPVLLWTAAVATFVPKVANDYSLFFVPMAALALWDRRDPMWAQLTLGLMLLWAQPIAFVISPSVTFAAKLGALFALAACLLQRIQEQTASAPDDTRPNPLTPCRT